MWKQKNYGLKPEVLSQGDVAKRNEKCQPKTDEALAKYGWEAKVKGNKNNCRDPVTDT